MRFMMMIQSNARAEAGEMPDETLLSEMGAFNQKLLESGALLAGDGLKASAHGTRVRYDHGKVTVVDGPFTEAKEMLGGFWLIQVKSRQEAIEWAKRVPGNQGQIEIRALYELSDFPADASEAPGGWRDQEHEMRDNAAPTAQAAPQVTRKPGTARYMIMLRSNLYTESGDLPGPETLAAMGALLEEGAQSGALLGGEGLKPSRTGARVKLAGEKRTVIDGPFTEAKEMIAGYTLLQTRTKSEAIEFAQRWIKIHCEGVHGIDGEIEDPPGVRGRGLPRRRRRETRRLARSGTPLPRRPALTTLLLRSRRATRFRPGRAG